MQTTMTASEFEKNVENLLKMVKNGSQVDLTIVPDTDGTNTLGWSKGMQDVFAQPDNPSADLEPDPFPRTHTPIVVSNPFSQTRKEKKQWTDEELALYPLEHRDIIKRGWTPEMAVILTEVNPNWHLEPDFLPPKEMDDFRDPFADETEH